MTLKTILITGCTKGIGRALALKFAAKNLKVYAVGRDPTLLDKLAKESSNIQPIGADITTIKGQAIINKALQQEVSFSIIHNAGISISSPFKLLPEKILREHFETNFFSPLLITQMLLPQLRGQRVLNISSSASVMALGNKIPYCTSKGAMHHAMQCLNQEFKSHGAYFANLRPGMVDTPMQETLRNENLGIPATDSVYIRAKEEGKLIAPEMVAEFVAWVMLQTDSTAFTENFWNIYDETHQPKWLSSGHQIKPI